jgi:hypothetical protein
MRKMVESVLRGLRQSFTGTVQGAIMEAVGEVLRNVMRKLFMVLLGAAAAVFGMVLLCLGLVKLIAVFLQEWLAWIIVGLAMTVLGALILFSSMPRRRH